MFDFFPFSMLIMQLAHNEIPFLNQPDLETFSDLILVIDQSYSFHVHQAFMCTRTEYFSALVKNHFNEMIPSSTDQLHPRPRMFIKHIRKELFLPLLYYIYSDECHVRDLVMENGASHHLM